MTSNRTQQTDPNPQHYLQVYQQVWSLYQTNNDNYFKRTQILMFAIQIAVFAAIVKLIGDIGDNGILPKSELGQAALWTMPFVGFLAALAWAILITRQWNILELYRRYMRYLERVLMVKCHVPLAPFTLEKAVFIEQKCILFDSCAATSNPQAVGSEQEYFPERGQAGGMKIKMMRIEEYMAVFLMSFWFACPVTLGVYRSQSAWACPWFIPIFIFSWAGPLLLWRFAYKPYKKRRGHKTIKGFSEFMQNG